MAAWKRQNYWVSPRFRRCGSSISATKRSVLTSWPTTSWRRKRVGTERILAIELQALVDMNFEIELTGFEMAEVDLILDEATEIKQTALLPEDTIPELSAEPPVTQRGDLWLLGAHRLYCGD